MSSILEKAKLAATSEVKKVALLIFIGVELLLFGVIFGVPITLDTNLGRVLAVLGFILTLVGSVGAIITYYEVYNDYITANIPELQAKRVLTSVAAPKVRMLDEEPEAVRPRTVEAADLWPAPFAEAKPKTRRHKQTAAVP